MVWDNTDSCSALDVELRKVFDFIMVPNRAKVIRHQSETSFQDDDNRSSRDAELCVLCGEVRIKVPRGDITDQSGNSGLIQRHTPQVSNSLV